MLKYLARYTHRVAISNGRLLDLGHGRVTFRYKDYADARQHKTMTLTAEEFLRRFVQHVLPKQFVKIRHYGLLANAQRQARLDACRRWPPERPEPCPLGQPRSPGASSRIHRNLLAMAWPCRYSAVQRNRV